VLGAVLEALRQRGAQSTGQLFREACAGACDRRAFERLLEGLTRAGLVRVSAESFAKDGQTIHFQRACLTAEGQRAAPGCEEAVQLTVEPAAARTRRAPRAPRERRGRERRSPGAGGLRDVHAAAGALGALEAGERPAAGAAKRRGKRSRPHEPLAAAAPPASSTAPLPRQAGVLQLPGAGATRPAAADAVPAELVAALKAWRAGEAKRRRIPAFRVMTDRALTALAAARPQDEEGLLAISGIGPTIVSKYGDALIDLVGKTGAR
jgi:DNA topoisomerase-3